MKKCIFFSVLAVALFSGSTVSASTFEINFTDIGLDGITTVANGSIVSTDSVVSGTISGVREEGVWSADAFTLFDVAGDHNWSGVSPFGTVPGLGNDHDPIDDEYWIYTFSHDFTLTENQFAVGFSFDWSYSIGYFDIPLLAIFECAQNDCQVDATSLFLNVDPTFTAVVTSGTVPSAVPLPAATWLFGSGILALAGFARRRF